MRQFASITGTDEILAQSILQDVKWNLESALNVFFGGSQYLEERPGDEESPKDHEAASTKSSRSPTDIQGLEVSLLSWNIDGLDGNSLATRMKAVYFVIKSANADFVFLQEVVEREINTFQKLEKSYNVYYSNRGSQYFTAILVSKVFTVENHEVIYYRNSGMMRTLQIVEGRIGEQKVFLLNTHLESMAEHKKKRCEQFIQCMAKVKELTTRYPNCLLYFGGDLNLRDDEVSNVPSGVADAWLAAGADKKVQYTWDTRQNDNKQAFGARCRFDRIFFSGPLRRVQFSLQGKQRIRTCLCFPSDHWAVHCTFS